MPWRMSLVVHPHAYDPALAAGEQIHRRLEAAPDARDKTAHRIGFNAENLFRSLDTSRHRNVQRTEDRGQVFDLTFGCLTSDF